ncbi:hypothetical protein M9H77_23875 [Catharanthus roseus]|uniref:Uncharacterized protein n=1 Tax=Catharanthus roseus TaxID=4058 RepID=A0ACC0AVR9_CATRO|nr:hypothetical protein M9H77_23875 [Catharanthus roseus]
MEEEHQGKIARFKKIIQGMASQVIGDQEDDFKRSKTVLWFSVQVEESKEANLGRLEASKTKGEPFLHPTADGNLFLLVSSMKNGPSSHLSLEDPLMSSSVIFDPSFYGFGNLDDTSLVELNIVGFALGIDRNFLQHACTIHQ